MKMRIQSRLSKRQEMSTLTGRLRVFSRKITGPRHLILDILHKQSRPLTTKEILAATPKDQCDLATVYRSMHLLEEMKMVKRVDFGDGAARFELIGEGTGEHHHHLVCNRCKTVVEIGECSLHEIESRLGAANGFTAVTHKLEFFGVCSHCQKHLPTVNSSK
jgi:Fur family ferric uptake transcriptional regulator